MAYNINVVNGTATENILNGDYSVSTNVTGYDNNTIDPISVTISEGVNEYNFTVAATGTLTVHISETGVADGTPIVGAKIIRCDSEGNTYGSEATTNVEGNAILANVPYAASDAPTIYFKQTASDGTHEFPVTLQSTTMTTQTSTFELQNPMAALRTINYTDKNYEGLKITGTINLN